VYQPVARPSLKVVQWEFDLLWTRIRVPCGTVSNHPTREICPADWL